MQDDDKDLIQLGDNSKKNYDISTVASQYSLVDNANEPGSHDTFEPEEGRELTREAGELRIQGVEFTNQAINEIIYKVLDKVKSQHMSQKRIIHLFCRILTFTSEYLHDKMEAKDPKTSEQEVGEPLFVESKEILTPDDKRKFCELVDKIEESVKKNYEMLQTDKIDDFVDGIMNDETKKFIFDEFQSDNVDDMITTLFDDIMKLDEDSDIDHMKFNDFIDKILGKETREYIADKLKTFASVKQTNIEEKNNV